MNSGIDNEKFENSKSAPQMVAGQHFAGKFEVLSHIGTGNLGSVYKAKHLVLNSHVALKVLEIDKEIFPTFSTEFQRDAVEAFSLNHKNLCRVFDMGVTADDAPYFTMEFLDGISLTEYLRVKGTISWSVCKTILMQILDGVEYAHTRGFVHLNLSPSKIIFVDGNVLQLQIRDIGLGRIAIESLKNRDGLELSQALGYSSYRSPESFVGNIIDRRRDIYSIGCTLFEMLTGSPPPAGRSDDGASLEQHQFAESQNLKKYAPHAQFPKQLQNIVAKMLSPSPDSRYASIAEVRSDLNEFKESGEVESLASGSNKGYWLTALVAVLILGSVAGAVPFIYNSSGDSVSAPSKPKEHNSEVNATNLSELRDDLKILAGAPDRRDEEAEIQIDSFNDNSFSRVHPNAWQEYQVANEFGAKGKWIAGHIHYANSLNQIISDRKIGKADIHDVTWLARSYGLVALCLAERKLYGEALKHLDEAERLDQYVADNKVLRANIYWVTKQDPKAREWLQKLKHGEYLFVFPAWAKKRKLCRVLE